MHTRALFGGGSVYAESAMFSGLVRAGLAAVLSSLVFACSATGPYVWADQVNSPAGTAAEGTIQDGDAINIKVFNQEAFSGVQKVRSDGKIALPVIGDVMARGKRPAQLATELQERLKTVFKEPSVTVTLEGGEAGGMKVAVLGEVKNPQVVPLEHGANVLTAIAAGGGLSDFADSDRIFVIRRSLPQRVRFRYQDLRAGEPRSLAFSLQAGDVVVVE